jgi:uncharacterized protein YjbJ (UPF0337 family)
MNANQDILQGQWPELKSQVKRRWDKLTDDDLQRLSGTLGDLVGVLRQKYGYGKAQSEIEVSQWLDAHATPPPVARSS